MLIYMTLLAIDALAVHYIIANAASGVAYVTLSIVGAVGLLVAFRCGWIYATLARRWRRPRASCGANGRGPT